MSLISGIAGVIASSLSMSIVSAQTWIPSSRLYLASPSEGDNLGAAVAVADDRVAIGAPNRQHTGRVFVFRREGDEWSLEAQIVPPIGTSGFAGFGNAVAMSGSILIVGAYDDSERAPQSGSASIYRRVGTDWVFEEKLHAPDAAPQDWFGYSVAVSQDTAVVGSVQDDDLGTTNGAVYVFRRVNDAWVFEAKLNADPGCGCSGIRLGHSLAIDSDMVVAGAPGWSFGGTPGAGAVLVFSRVGSAWSTATPIQLPQPVEFDAFGTAVSVDRKLLVVGAPRTDAGSGRVFWFKRLSDTWEYGGEIAPVSGGTTSSRAGCSVAINGGWIVVGHKGASFGGVPSGAAHVFERQGVASWDLVETVVPEGGATGELFGSSVSVSGRILAVGAPLDSSRAHQSGVVHVYLRRCPADLNGDDFADFPDYLIFLNLYEAGDFRADFNHDELVDFADYLLFLNWYGNSCEDD